MNAVCQHAHLGWDSSFKSREALRWGVAALVVLSLHVGAVAAAHIWQDTPPPPAEEAASAIMVDLAPLSVAPESIPDDMPDIVQTSLAIEPVEETAEKVEPTATPTTQPVTETAEATQETAEPVTEDALEPTEAEPVEQEEAETVDEVEEVIPDLEEAPLPEVAMALPSPRPEPVQDKPEPVQRKVTKPAPKKPVEKKAEPKPRAVAAASSQARAEISRQATAAPKPSVGGKSGGDAEAAWLTKVNRYLARRLGNVRDARPGTASVLILFNSDGNVTSARLVSSSGDGRTDAAILQRIQNSTVPTPPSEVVTRRLQLPLRVE